MANRLIKLAISLVVALGDLLVRLVCGRNCAGRCTVINYHSILNDSRAQFARQLDLLPRLAQPIFAAKPTNLERGTRYVAITVDDLFCSFVENGLPELSKRNIPVTLFVPTDYMGRASAWEDYGGENKVGEVVAPAEEVKRISALANVDFGSHCATHPDMARISEADARRELRSSKETLETLTGRKITSLSFPYGSYSSRDLRLAGEAGYQFYFDSTPESVFDKLAGGLIGRVSVQPTDWDIEFRLKVLGAYRWVRWMSVQKKKLFKPQAAPEIAVAKN